VMAISAPAGTVSPGPGASDVPTHTDVPSLSNRIPLLQRLSGHRTIKAGCLTKRRCDGAYQRVLVVIGA